MAKTHTCKVLRAEDPDAVGRCWVAVVRLHGGERNVILKYPTLPAQIVGKNIELEVVDGFPMFLGVADD